MAETLQKKDASATTQEGSMYQIDPSWYEKNSKSLALGIAQRRCPTCQKKALREKAGKEGWKEQMKTIVEHCSKDATFILPETPLLEAAFRTILANGNRLTSLEDIYAVIKKRWAVINSMKDIRLEVLKRVLDRDTYYGIMGAEKEAPPPS